MVVSQSVGELNSHVMIHTRWEHEKYAANADNVTDRKVKTDIKFMSNNNYDMNEFCDAA